jgi:glycosyltransferase involved in cell wall biosynthesis
VPYKGCDMAIRAAAPALRQGRLQLTVVGDGPERPALEALAAREGVAEKVHFAGRTAPAEVHRYYAASDLLLFPSVREFGGGVVLEALTSGVVPIVVDYGGPGELVTETTGIKVPLAERDAIVRGLHAGLEQLLAAPARLATMAAAGQRRVDDLFTWQRKAAQISAVYAWSTGETCAKPHFAFSGEGTDEPSRTRNGGNRLSL